VYIFMFTLFRIYHMPRGTGLKTKGIRTCLICRVCSQVPSLRFSPTISTLSRQHFIYVTQSHGHSMNFERKVAPPQQINTLPMSVWLWPFPEPRPCGGFPILGREGRHRDPKARAGNLLRWALLSFVLFVFVICI